VAASPVWAASCNWRAYLLLRTGALKTTWTGAAFLSEKEKVPVEQKAGKDGGEG